MHNIITIEDLVSLSAAGRVAARGFATFGQTEAGCHACAAAERLVEVRAAPCGGEVVGGPPIYTWRAGSVTRPAGASPIHHDPKTGAVWWGATTTLRVLPYAGARLFCAGVQVDAENLAYQRALMGRGS